MLTGFSQSRSRGYGLHSHQSQVHTRGQQDEYGAVDIGGLLDFDKLTRLVEEAASKLPPNQRLRAGEVWGYYIRVHVSEQSAEAVIVRPYPYRTWAW